MSTRVAKSPLNASQGGLVPGPARLGARPGPNPFLAQRRKSDPAKLAIAGRLRRETTLSIIAIAAQVQLGTSKGANSNLHRWMRRTRARKSGNKCLLETEPTMQGSSLFSYQR
jgi:hypothetical protein